MIDPQAPRRGLDSMKPEVCKHPNDQIIDRPDRSYCRKCGQDVAPPQKVDGEPTRMGIFPSVNRMDWMGGGAVKRWTTVVVVSAMKGESLRVMFRGPRLCLTPYTSGSHGCGMAAGCRDLQSRGGKRGMHQFEPGSRSIRLA